MNKAVFSLMLAVALLGCTEKPAETIDTRPLVRIGAVSNDVEFAEALNVQGMIRAKNVAAVAARVPGTIDAMLADEGLSVTKGTPLARIDQVNLKNAVRAAKDDLAMAKAKLAQAEATCAKAQLDVERMTRLVKEGAVTKDMFEKADVAAKSSAAARNAAKAGLTKAETGLAVAEKNFADSEVKAPFDGIITKRNKNAGDFCAPGVKIFDLEDTSCYEVCISLNAAHYPQVSVGETEIEMHLNGKDNQLKKVSYKAPSVNPLTRTFEVRAVVAKTEALASGMLVSCRVVFSRRKAQALPAGAVANRDGGDCVFTVKDGRVVRVPVTAGLSSGGLREIASPRLATSDAIIVEGMLLVNAGDDVRVTP